MSLETPTWPKITGALGTTTTEFGASDWANLISDYYNGVNLALVDASKIPIIGTLTRYKHEKIGLFDIDESHYIIFSADDIDTGANRKIKFRRMNAPFEEDHAVLEGMPQTLLNKTVDFSLNTGSNIPTSAISDNAITNDKMADNSIGTAEIIDGSVNSAKITDDSIMNIDINSNAGITDGKLAQITNKAKLPNSTVYTDQINTYDSGQLQTFRSTYFAWFDSNASHRFKVLTTDLTVADVNLTIDRTTDGIFAFTDDIRFTDQRTPIDNSVTSVKIFDGAVTLDKLSTDSVNSSKIVDNSIVDSDIGTHTSTKITLTNKSQLNTQIAYKDENTWLTNAMISASAAIETTKLADSNNFILKTLDNNFGAHYIDIGRIIATPANPSVNDLRIYNKQIDSNNDGAFILVKKNGSFQEVQLV